jgi:hypothetical protein
MGMIAYAKDPDAYDSYDKLAYLAFFDLLAPLNKGWQILVNASFFFLLISILRYCNLVKCI